MTLRTSLLAAGAALIAITSAQVSQSGAAYSMKMKWTKGKTYAYNITYTMKMGSTSTPSKASYTMTVKDVQKGIATVVAKANVPGVSNGESQTLKIDSYGKVVGGSSSAMNMTALPTKAVKVGEKWSSTRKMSQPMPFDMKSTFVFKGIKTVNNKKYAELSETMSGTSGAMTMSGTGTILLDMADGMLFKYSNSAKVVIKQGKETQTIPVTSVVTRTK